MTHRFVKRSSSLSLLLSRSSLFVSLSLSRPVSPSLFLSDLDSFARWDSGQAGSIRPSLSSASSPQMASLIDPFSRFHAAHLKYAAADTSCKRLRVAKGAWRSGVSALLLETSVSLPARCDGQIMMMAMLMSAACLTASVSVLFCSLCLSLRAASAAALTVRFPGNQPANQPVNHLSSHRSVPTLPGSSPFFFCSCSCG